MKSTLLFVLGGLIVLSAQPVMAAAIPLEGQLIQGGLIYGYAAPGQQIYYRDHRLQLSADGLFIVGFGRDAEPEQQLVIVHQGGRQETLRLKLKPRQYKIERINGISKKMLNPGPDELKRIAHEAGLVAEARRRTSPSSIFASSLSGRSQVGSAAFMAASGSSTGNPDGPITVSILRPPRGLRSSLRPAVRFH